MGKLSIGEVESLIQNRRSLYPRVFSQEKATKDEIAQLLGLARWAPSHKLTQPWHFVVFMGDKLHQLMELQQEIYLEKTEPDKVLQSKLDKLSDNALRSSAFIAVIMRRDEAERVPVTEEVCSVACAVQNMYLAMPALGLAGYWSTGGATNEQPMREYLGLKEKDMHLGWLIIGKSEVELPTPSNRKGLKDYVEWR